METLSRCNVTRHNELWREVRSAMLNYTQTYFAQNGMWSLTFTQISKRMGYTGYAYYAYFDSAADFEAAYIAYRSGLDTVAQRAMAVQRGCIAAWNKYQTQLRFDVAE